MVAVKKLPLFVGMLIGGQLGLLVVQYFFSESGHGPFDDPLKPIGTAMGSVLAAAIITVIERIRISKRSKKLN